MRRGAAAVAVLAYIAGASGTAAQGVPSTDRVRALELAERAARAAEDAARSAGEAAVAARRAAEAARAAVLAAGIDLPGEPGRVAISSRAEVLAPPPATLVPTGSVPVRVDVASVPSPVQPDTTESRESFNSKAFMLHSAMSAGSGSVTRYARIPDFELLMSSKDKVGTFSWNTVLSDEYIPASVDPADQTKAPGKGGYSANTLSITATTKLNEGEATFGTLDGFTGGTEAKIAFAHYEGDLRLSKFDLYKKAYDEAVRVCLKQNSNDPEKAKKVCDGDAPESRGKAAFTQRYNPEGLVPATKAMFPGVVKYYGGSLGVNQTDFTYLSRSPFAEAKTSKLGLVATAFGGALFNEGLSSVTGSYTYRRKYKAADPIELCQPEEPPFTQCLTAPNGKPTRKTANILALDWRQTIPSTLWNYTRMAIAPKVSYDVTGDIFGVDVPLYLARDETGLLRGGLRAIYIDKPNKDGGRDTDFTLGVFIGVPFNILGN